MNTHARNPSYKLTMVSVVFREERKVIFAYLPVINGKAIASSLLINAQFPHMPNGCTFRIGA